MILFNNKFKLTQKYLEKTFDACNTIYFNNELIKIPILLTEDDSANGYFKFDIDFKNRLLNNPRIEISNKHRSKFVDLEQTILHEMIHYKVFMELSGEEINAAFSAYETKNTELFNRLLYLGDFAHINKWQEYKNSINNKYKMNIR